MWVFILVMFVYADLSIFKAKKRGRTQSEKDNDACCKFCLIFEAVFCITMDLFFEGKTWALWILALDIAIQGTILVYDSKVCRSERLLNKEREMLKALSASYINHLRREKNESNKSNKVCDIWTAYRVAEIRAELEEQKDIHSRQNTAERARGENRIYRSGRKKSA